MIPLNIRLQHPHADAISDQISNKAALSTGSFGYMAGSNCEPMFKFAGTINGNQSTLVDVYYEVKF